ncbi:unnamed protein product [Mytilus edulis]|uniref:Mutator-like transposase domain-containing protein n=1 Tax=Mytilus edulis TaxID=6550 RepID=A0A8S3U8D4_MYTED|nr:unnamed protein product [Mytilus edulis]
MFNLYNEVIAKKRGRRTAAINLSIQVALNHIAISTTGLQKLFLGSNIPAPSTSSLQHSANVVSEIIEEYNQKDLVQKRKLIKEINILRGDNPNIINIQADGMYNNPIYSGMGKTPFQPATQCTYNIMFITRVLVLVICIAQSNSVSRNVVKELSVSNGEGWGDWCNLQLCPQPGQYDYGYRMKGAGRVKDDTAANYVKFECRGLNGGYQEIKKQPRQRGYGDLGTYGSWSRSCDTESAICGIQTRTESSQGGGIDDTALNNVKFVCCRD